MKSIRLPLDRVKLLWAKELLTSSLALIVGGAYRVPRTMGRNTNPSVTAEGWHRTIFFSTEPAELFRECADYRAVALEHLAADAPLSGNLPDGADAAHFRSYAPEVSRSDAVARYLNNLIGEPCGLIERRGK
jgi:hypothetical protein